MAFISSGTTRELGRPTVGPTGLDSLATGAGGQREVVEDRSRGRHVGDGGSRHGGRLGGGGRNQLGQIRGRRLI
jgi:hypothetical protein